MVLLIKNRHASFDDSTPSSDSPAGDTPRRRLAKFGMQSLSNADVPKAKSMPHINLLVEGRSLKAHCTAVLNGDLHKLKPRGFIARKVKSAKEDLKQLFHNASPKQRVDPTRGPSNSISIELTRSTTASNVGTSGSLYPLSPLAKSDPPSDEQDKEDQDHLQCLVVISQRWLNSERLFSRRCALFDQTIEEARHDFCQALVRSFSDCPPIASSLQVPQSPSNHFTLPLPHPIFSSPVASTSPSVITLADQTTLSPCLFGYARPKKPTQSPEFSDEDLEREFDNFSFHSSQEEEWSSEVESRKQNAMNQALSDMKRKLAVPVPKLSSYFSDDSLADSAAHRTLVNPRASCSGASSQDAGNTSCYSADQEDEAKKDDESVAVSPLDSLVGTATVDDDAAIIPACHELPLSSYMGDPTSNKEQDHSDIETADIADGIDDVREALATYVPRLVTCVSEQWFADEYKIEATGQPPPLSYPRPVSQYRKTLRFRCQGTSHPGRTSEVTSTIPLAKGTGSFEATSSNVGTSVVTTDTDSDPSLSSVLNTGKTLRRVRKFRNLKDPAKVPTAQSTSSIETIRSLHEACPPESRVRRLRRIPGCLNWRKVFDRTDTSMETPPGLSEIQARTLYSLQSLGQRTSLKEWHRPSDLRNCEIQPVSSRCPTLTRKDSSKPSIPLKPSSFRLHWKKTQLPSTTIQEPSSPCSACDPSSSLPLWSCGKITRSKEKRGRATNESTNALKKRLDSIRIDPESIHGHAPSDVARNSHSPRLPTKIEKQNIKKFWSPRKIINESNCGV